MNILQEAPAEARPDQHIPGEAPAGSPLGILQSRIIAMRLEAEDILSCELEASGEPFPPASAGSHIDIYLPNGLVRSYSLTKACSAGENYHVAVSKAADSRGGSRFVHEEMRVGQSLQISTPRNNFELADNAPHSVLIAGGIGITPILSMITSLANAKKAWSLYYFARNPGRAPFRSLIDGLASCAGAKVHYIYSNAQDSTKRISIAEICEAASSSSHFYCCGPASMIDEFERMISHISPERVHLERFSAGPQNAAPADEFVVELARSGKTLNVPKGASILDTLLDAGIDAAHSCKEGVCGACEVRVLDGVPDHRDFVLSPAEKLAGKSMLICCSTAKSERLRLDI